MPLASVSENSDWNCDGDVDGDGQVNAVDAGIVQANFGNTSEQATGSPLAQPAKAKEMRVWVAFAAYRVFRRCYG